MKIFIRERRRSDKGDRKPRYRVVGVYGGDLTLTVKRIRKCELDEIVKATGAEVVLLARDGDGNGGGKEA